MSGGLSHSALREFNGVSTQMPCDAAGLRQRSLSGRDPVALEAVVRLYGPLVLRVCRRWLRDQDRVDDAFQATFLVFMRRSSQLRDWERLGPWLHEVATRVARRSRADSRRQHARESALDHEPADGNAPDPSAVELAYLLDQEIRRLRTRDRDVLILCDLQGLSHAETARRLGIPLGTVKSRQARARAKLRGRLTRRGLTPQTCAGVLALPPPLQVLSHRRILTAIPSLDSSVSNLMPGGAVSASAFSLAKGVSTMMWVTHWAKVAAPVLLLGIGAYAISQESAPTPSGFPRSTEVKTGQAEEDPAVTIRRIEKEWGEAILERDAETVAPFLADDFIGTDRHGNVFDKVTYLGGLKKGFGAVKIEFPEMKVRIYGDTAVVTGVVRYAKESTTTDAGRIGLTNPDGKAISAAGFTLQKEASDRYTSTYIKQRGRWRCVVYQASSYLEINGLEVNPTEYFEAPIRRAR